MTHTDKVVKDMEFSYEGVFDFREFISYLRDFFKRHNYDINEKSHSSSAKEELKNTKIKWDCDRKLDDYNHAHIKIKINLGDFRESRAENKKVVEGKLKLEAEAEIERDYDKRWEGGAARKFIMTVYEKYGSSGKQKKFDSAVKKTAEDLMADVRQYFNAR